MFKSRVLSEFIRTIFQNIFLKCDRESLGQGHGHLPGRIEMAIGFAGEVFVPGWWEVESLLWEAFRVQRYGGSLLIGVGYVAWRWNGLGSVFSEYGVGHTSVGWQKIGRGIGTRVVRVGETGHREPGCAPVGGFLIEEIGNDLGELRVPIRP